MKNDFYINHKVLLFGIPQVGKSTLAKRLESSNTFLSEYIQSPHTIINTRISTFHQDHRLDLNLYEISIPLSGLIDTITLRNLLFECQCIIFLIDITNPQSLMAIQSLQNKITQCINLNPNLHLTLLLLINKVDITNSVSRIDERQLTTFFQSNPAIQSMEISLKNPQENLVQIKQMIHSAVNNPNNKLALNIVKRSNEDHHKDQYTIRCIFLGDSAVGKTSLIRRHSNKNFTEKFLSTLGIDDFIQAVMIRDEIYKLQLWDTAGQERFRSLPKKYYMNADGIFLLFSLDSKTSFNNLEKWIIDIQANINRSIDGNDATTTMFLIGNKSDMIEEREVTREEAEAKAKVYNLEYYEVSCKDNLNIEESIGNMLVKCYAKSKGITDCFSLEEMNKKKKKNNCCK